MASPVMLPELPIEERLVGDLTRNPDFRNTIIDLVEYMQGLAAGLVRPERLLELTSSQPKVRQRLWYIFELLAEFPSYHGTRDLAERLQFQPDVDIFLNPVLSEQGKRWRSSMPTSSLNNRCRVIGSLSRKDLDEILGLYNVYPSNGNASTYIPTEEALQD